MNSPTIWAALLAGTFVFILDIWKENTGKQPGELVNSLCCVLLKSTQDFICFFSALSSPSHFLDKGLSTPKGSSKGLSNLSHQYKTFMEKIVILSYHDHNVAQFQQERSQCWTDVETGLWTSQPDHLLDTGIPAPSPVPALSSWSYSWRYFCWPETKINCLLDSDQDQGIRPLLHRKLAPSPTPAPSPSPVLWPDNQNQNQS